ncbi:MAG: YjbH domain-containing protein [Tolumonas sp.]|nr:YjbH domain-containing protein [Tolumonas sp.]
MNSKLIKFNYLFISIFFAISPSIEAQENDLLGNKYFDYPGVSQSDFGGTGLLQTPTARMAEDGEFSLNYRDNNPYRRYSISLQALSWLETTLTYTDVRTRLYSNDPTFSGNQTYKDKSFAFKANLIDEDYWIPAISLGARDIAGTGLFDSEYLVSSKHVGAFDVTLGLGWGNMAESANISNPFCKFKNSFCTRPGSTTTGQFNTQAFFHGPAALFGGVEYQTPWNPLRIKVEYDANDFSHEAAGNMTRSSPINAGLVYRVTDYLDTSLSYERGNQLMWGFTLRTNFSKQKPLAVLDDKPVTYHLQTRSGEENYTQLAKQLDDVAGYKDASVYKDKDQTTIVAEQYKYREKSNINNRTAVVLANHFSNDTKSVEVIDQRKNLPISSTKYDLDAVRENENTPVLGQSITKNVVNQSEIEKPTTPCVYCSTPKQYSFGLTPHIDQSFGGAESFYMYKFSVNADADVNLTDSWLAGSTVNFNVINDYNKFNYKTPPQDSSLPRVRTWIREYVTSSDVLVTNLQLTRLDHPANDWYSQIYGGYLEMMYAGLGSEVLYRPYGRSWAVGVDGNYVRQRDWNDIMQLADYDVFTGHVTTYWDLPYIKGGLARISAGQYLAGDKGITVDLSRKFDSGIVAGAFMTITNVSAAQYGEGSFTKGFYISIPFDIMSIRRTNNYTTLSWVPLTRDGGQMLGKRYGLYDLTNSK